MTSAARDTRRLVVRHSAAAADTAEPRLAFWEVRETGSLDHPQEVAP